MFRKMRRFKQKLSEAECIELLRQEPRGVLSVIGEDGYPYGIPMDHWFDEKHGRLCFHGAAEGHKIDALRAENRVSYCVYNSGYRNPGEWALNIRSVIVFGRMSIVNSGERKVEICTNLCKKFTDDPTYIERELALAGDRVCCLELEIEHMTGKAVKES